MLPRVAIFVVRIHTIYAGHVIAQKILLTVGHFFIFPQQLLIHFPDVGHISCVPFRLSDFGMH